MAYHALRPCHFAGTGYMIGDEVPAGVLVDGAAARLIRQRVLAYTADAEPAAAITETVTYDGDEVELTVTQDGMDLIVTVLTATVEGSASTIAAATDVDGLKLLHVVDSRSGIRTAVAARLAELEAAADSDDQEG